MTAPERFATWAILELMGHRRLGGYVTEQTIAGVGFLRIDVPSPSAAADGDTSAPSTTQLYSPSSVYCLTPTSEGVARAVAKHNQPEPMYQFEMPALTIAARARYADDDLDDDGVRE